MSRPVHALHSIVAASFIVLMTVSFSFSATEEHFSVKEYNDFHEVLHALQHDALPKKDYKTIRDRAAELVSLGDAIVKLNVPAGVKEPAEYSKELATFRTALEKYKTDAAGASDEQLEKSYLAVHDSFEMLAAMLPRR